MRCGKRNHATYPSRNERARYDGSFRGYDTRVGDRAGKHAKALLNHGGLRGCPISFFFWLAAATSKLRSDVRRDIQGRAAFPGSHIPGRFLVWATPHGAPP